MVLQNILSYVLHALPLPFAFGPGLNYENNARSPASSKLFEPFRVGEHTLAHRVVLAPLTRYRADIKHVHHDIAVEYYRQRSVVPGTLLITEATFIAPNAGGYDNVPGIYNDAQIRAWKKITNAVHENKGLISLQLWALGRTAIKSVLEQDGYPFVSASNISIPERATQGTPRALTIPEIKQYVAAYAQAAKDAIEKAGFDFVEIHGANGYLVDQFLEDVSNDRTDHYGGSIENRARFGLEVVKAVVDAVGEAKTSIRLSPYFTGQGMGLAHPQPTFSYIIKAISDLYPNLAYLHLIRSAHPEKQSLDFAQKIWGAKPLIIANNFQPDTAVEEAESTGAAIAFGRWFISNPDLPDRIRFEQPLTPFDYDTFYTHGENATKGYIDYPLHAPKHSA